MNNKNVQVRGPFFEEEEVVDRIKAESSDFRSISRIGICSKVRNYVKLNDEIFEIGKTGILQFKNVQITSIKFMQDETESTFVDCVLE